MKLQFILLQQNRTRHWSSPHKYSLAVAPWKPELTRQGTPPFSSSSDAQYTPSLSLALGIKRPKLPSCFWHSCVVVSNCLPHFSSRGKADSGDGQSQLFSRCFFPGVIFLCGSAKRLTISKVTPGNYYHTAFSKISFCCRGTTASAVTQDLSISSKTYFRSVVNRPLSP